MARPQKTGLDYFPLDCHLDKNLKAIIRKFNAEGFGVIVGLYQHIYADGYWLKWCEETAEDFALEIGVDEDILSQIVKFCVNREIFNSAIYKSNKVLTSRGIQKRYLVATERRKCKQLPLYNLINVDNNSVNVDNNPVNDNISTQSKVKESKVKETIYAFEEFWADYSFKKDKSKCEKLFSKIKEEDLIKIKETITDYVDSTNADYNDNTDSRTRRKYPATYLNSKTWDDEITKVKPKASKQTDCKLIAFASKFGDLDI